MDSKRRDCNSGVRRNKCETGGQVPTAANWHKVKLKWFIKHGVLIL